MKILLCLFFSLFSSVAYCQFPVQANTQIYRLPNRVVTETYYAAPVVPYYSTLQVFPEPTYTTIYYPLPVTKVKIRNGFFGHRQTIRYTPFVGYTMFGPLTWSWTQRYGY